MSEAKLRLFGQQDARGWYLDTTEDTQGRDTFAITLPMRDGQPVPGVYTVPDGAQVMIEDLTKGKSPND